MFDLTSSKLLILAVVALIVVGPKDLPVLLRTIGKYIGMIRRQANEFRSQFEEAMRESELADIRQEVEQLSAETQSTFNEASRTIESEVASADRELNASLAESEQPPQGPTDDNALKIAESLAPAAADAAPQPPPPEAAPLSDVQPGTHAGKDAMTEAGPEIERARG